MLNDAELVQVERRREWRRWLEENHTRPNGVWIVTFKKHCGEKHLPYGHVIEEALCFGWIDSLGRKLDKDRSMLWMSPRKPGSGWSKLNKERIERMIDTGLMTPAGLAKIEAAKQDGSWQALDAIETLEIPDDLESAFSLYDSARHNFNAFPRSARRAILEWIANAKKPETRAGRIKETARLAEENIRANQ